MLLPSFRGRSIFLDSGPPLFCSGREPDVRPGRSSRACAGNNTVAASITDERAPRRVIDGEAPCRPNPRVRGFTRNLGAARRSLTAFSPLAATRNSELLEQAART